MKKMPTKEQIVQFFETQYAGGTINEAKSAEEFVKTFNLDESDLEEFENNVLRIRMVDTSLPNEGSIEEKIAKFEVLKKFILAIKVSLGYMPTNYVSAGEEVLQKKIDPPTEAFNPIGHNKMNIKESKVAQGVMFK